MSVQYIAAAGSRRLRGGLNKWPSWRTAIAKDEWALMGASNTINDLDPEASVEFNSQHPGSAYWAPLGDQGNIPAWSSMVDMHQRGEIWVHGGGHDDYGGNEIYSLDYMRDTPVWTMRRPPSGAKSWYDVDIDDGNETSNQLSDGRPRSVHTYRQLINANGVFYRAPGGAVWRTGNGDDSTWKWDLATEDWATKVANALPTDPGADSLGGSCYDSKRHVIWHAGSTGFSGLHKFDVASGTWTNHLSGSINGTNYVTLRYDPVLDIIIVMNPAVFQYISFSGDTPQSPVDITKSGTATNILSVPGLGGMTGYDEARGCYYNWGPRADRTEIEKLVMSDAGSVGTWTVVSATTTNSVTPSLPYSTNSGDTTCDRFLFNNYLDCAFLINEMHQDVYVRAFS